jgi:hypothetical protein
MRCSIASSPLRRRATARKRIGVSYRFRELVDPWEWRPLTVQ